MRPLAILFDLDGTLVDTRADLANAINHARTQLGREPLDRDTIVSYVGDGMAKLIERSFDGRADRLERARALFDAHYAEHLTDNSPLYDGVKQGLAELAELDARMAVLTNKPERFARRLLDRHALTPYLRGVVGGDSLPTHKPDPEGALALLRAMDAPAEHAFMVGDHHTDLVTARRAGMRSVFCAYGFGAHREAPRDDVAHSFAEVTRIVRDAAPSG